RRFPSILRFCRRHGIDAVRDPIPVAPAAHYLMGGVRTDSWARTSLPGLFACGEVACTGVHGANRLASNSLLEGLVFGRRAVDRILRGDGAWEPLPKGRELPADLPPSRSGPLPPGLRRCLPEIMWRHAGLVRSADSLRAAREALADAHPPSAASPVGRDDHELANLALLSRLVVESALLRRESRGAHFRTDFPHRDRGWQGHIVLARDGASLVPLRDSAPVPVGAGHD
ncbi:MAG: FAD-binding protein, partial [Chloroflexi bacterium]|nr:FAD-binding protein [Chloroflexota bacterium]